MPKPTIDSRRAKVMFMLLTDELSEQDVRLNEAMDAHLQRNSDAFYAAITDAKQNQAVTARILLLLSQGRYEEAERELNINW